MVSQNVFEKCERLAAKHGASEVIFLGDLLHESTVDARTLKVLVDCLQAWEEPALTMLPGNHTAQDAVRGVFVENGLRNINPGFVTMIDGGDVTVRKRGWLTIHYVPYMENNDAAKAIEGIELDRKQFNLLAIHQSVAGCSHAGWTCKEDAGLNSRLFDRFDLTIAGHFHPHQTFRGGFYVGSPCQLDFRDGDQKRGAVLLTVNKDKTWKKKLIELDLPRFITVKGKVTSRGFEIDCDPSELEGHYVRVQYTGSNLAVKACSAEIGVFVEEVSKVALGVKKDPRLTYHIVKRAPGIKSGMSVRSMFDRYVESGVHDTTGLSKKRLSRIAHRAIEEASDVA